MDPPKVLLEAGFLAALAHHDHPRHHDAREQYEQLVRGYRQQELLLVAVGDHLRDLEVGPTPSSEEKVRWFLHRSRRGLFAPVDALYVGWQHRRAAARATGADASVALTLVMADRYKVRRIATFDAAYDDVEIDRYHLPAGHDDDRSSSVESGDGADATPPA